MWNRWNWNIGTVSLFEWILYLNNDKLLPLFAPHAPSPHCAHHRVIKYILLFSLCLLGSSHILGAGHPKHFAEAPKSPCLPFSQPSKPSPSSLTGKGLSSVIKSPRSGWNQPGMFIAWGQHGLMEKLLQSMSPPRGNRGVDWKQRRFLGLPPP